MTFWTTNKKTSPQRKNQLLRCLACEALENEACSDGCWETHHESSEELFSYCGNSPHIPTCPLAGRAIEIVRSSLATPDNTILACDSLRVSASHSVTLCAACQHGIGVQILTDVSVSLHDAPKDTCCEKTLAQTLAMLDVVNSHAVQGPSAIQSDLVVEACVVPNKRTAPRNRSAKEDTCKTIGSQSNWKKDRLLMDTTEEVARIFLTELCSDFVPRHQHCCTTRGRKLLDRICLALDPRRLPHCQNGAANLAETSPGCGSGDQWHFVMEECGLVLRRNRTFIMLFKYYLFDTGLACGCQCRSS